MDEQKALNAIFVEFESSVGLNFFHTFASSSCKNVIVIIPPKHISPCYAQFGVFIIAIEPPFLRYASDFV